MTSSRANVPAGVGRRCLQYFLDEMLVMVLLFVPVALGIIAFTPIGRSTVAFVKGVFLGYCFLAMLAGILLHTWWPWRHDGQTPAMRWLGLRIVTTTGEPPPLRAYVVRQFLVVVDGFAWGLVGVVLMLATRHHQRLGDLVAGTLVVRTR
ncbi:putative RDD family membrane protein YckC [Amycolatopsis bartoniae]|uniref:Transporter n=1 Tax=Amycolatopsis bartoniae TaxID=941986 RepID=A0A8H9MCX9_9PSEU|nr:RDD family protein [Amycolatopsis bartoniae]MBB2938960.1 putative RDD family membrane protein YckC [Amycolatopsis bartoniae]GHF65917.1 transporter [Amycolatopsis bartoniae]